MQVPCIVYFAPPSDLPEFQKDGGLLYIYIYINTYQPILFGETPPKKNKVENITTLSWEPNSESLVSYLYIYIKKGKD